MSDSMHKRTLESYQQCQTLNERGEWVPAIPEPFHGSLRYQCFECRERFWTMEGYAGHYAYRHIFGMPRL